MCCFTCHVSLCLLEPTGNLQIMETQFHNSLIPSWEKQLQICMLQTYSADTQTGTWPYTWKNIVQSQRFLKTRFSSFVCMWAVQQHPSIWRLFPKRSGKFFFCKHFKGCIVGYLNFIGLSAKTLENLYHKVPKISLLAYNFQRPFLRGLHSEGLIYGGKFAFQNRLG